MHLFCQLWAINGQKRNEASVLRMHRLNVLAVCSPSKNLNLIKGTREDGQVEPKYASILPRDLDIHGIWFYVCEALKPSPGDTEG